MANTASQDTTANVMFSQNGLTDFNANLAIVNPSPLTKQNLQSLPDNYDKTQNSGNFALVYGTGYAQEQVKQTLLQLEANNYLYSPDVQQGTFFVAGAGRYLIEYNIPFVVPPLNVSVSGADSTDVFVEFTSRFGMVINVLTDANDQLQWRASGFVGAATTEVLGDALYNNFGALYQFPRQGTAVIDDTYVRQYESFNKFVTAQTIISVQRWDSVNQVWITNPPPVGVPYVQGNLRSTNVIVSPEATEELVDNAGNFIALINSSASVITDQPFGSQLTTDMPVSALYVTNTNDPYVTKTDHGVYIIGPVSTFAFDRWKQPSYVQEAFRADNVYRRILSAINRSLALGPNVQGLAKMVEALIAQPFIPHENWDDSDYRLFMNSEGMSQPKYYGTRQSSSGTSVDGWATQYEGYPTTAPTVEVRRVEQQWSPDTITYNTKPQTVSLDQEVAVQVTGLNQATRFDISAELQRQLRLALDFPEGGIIKWNWDSAQTIPATGLALYEQNNYVFLNNAGDSTAGINLFWYAQTDNTFGPTGYEAYGPLQYAKDYFVIATNKFYNRATGGYQLPSELLFGYNANSDIPYADGHKDVYGNTSWKGATLVANGKLPANTPSLPPSVIQLDLRNLTVKQNGVQTKFPTNPYDFIIYSYGQVTLMPAVVEGNLMTATEPTSSVPTISAYYESETSSALQPTDSPFTTAAGKLAPNALAQTSFAKLVTNTNYEYVLSMVGGQITFYKTCYVDDLKRQTASNDPNATPPAILVLQAYQANSYTDTLPASGVQIGINQYVLHGVVDNMIASDGSRYFEFAFGDYVLLDKPGGNPIAVFDSSSPISVDLPGLVGQKVSVWGVVFSTLWDTRIAVTDYRTTSPIFQATTNFDAEVKVYTPEIVTGLNYKNKNYLVQIVGLPLGNQQTVTASWTFNIQQTGTGVQSASSMAFSDILNGGSVQYGIMSTFTGLPLVYNNLDPDNASYEQQYVSPSFNAYFLNYYDYINVAGSKLTPQGDANLIDTLTGPATKPAPTTPNLNTMMNFFSQNYGFISVSVLPNQEFYDVASGGQVQVVRPNNNGIALKIKGDSYAGLAFYGTNSDVFVDKPTRLIVDFTYATANEQVRKKIVEIEDGGFANYVDAKHPTTVMKSDVFYLAGNQFKYAHEGWDQSPNPYTTNEPATGLAAGDYYVRNPQNPTAFPPIFTTDPSQNGLADVDNTLNFVTEPGMQLTSNRPGTIHRYRRPPFDNDLQSVYQTPDQLAINMGYMNKSPEKTAFLQFDLSDFPYDAIINDGILEVYFASGFTIKEGRDTNFVLNDNVAWQRSRLSGNGMAYQRQLTDNNGKVYSVIQPYGNVHWRKNYFEVVIPYAFKSEPTDMDYGIRRLFAPQQANMLPGAMNPQPMLEYLGFLNIDEINVAGLTHGNMQENSVGLANIILSSSSIIYQINGILNFNQNGYDYTLANCIDTKKGIIYSETTNCTTVVASGGTILGKVIDQKDVLPNMKVLVYPFGTDSNIYFYGYVTSLMPSSQIGFNDNDISIYQQAFAYIQPLYSEYVVKLLEADTYFPYKVFGKESVLENTTRDIAY